MDYCLRIIFKTKGNTVLYDGESYLRKNLRDYIKISDRKVEIRFSRAKRMDIDNILNSPNSLIRYELQKALCYYLASKGSIPAVSRVEVQKEDQITEVNHQQFTDSWRECFLEETILGDKLNIIFSEHENAKNLYIALTYFIKVQLDQFSNDCFRAAWSGMNAVYRLYRDAENESEKEQIKNCPPK